MAFLTAGQTLQVKWGLAVVEEAGVGGDQAGEFPDEVVSRVAAPSRAVAVEAGDSRGKAEAPRQVPRGGTSRVADAGTTTGAGTWSRR
mmetsp:Transcript_29541/g.83327  ORF Transcript_29541/g.83327 Transcript_29541/m.83327 type:complete len:88 (+) Transcript_29541:523-786(+)